MLFIYFFLLKIIAIYKLINVNTNYNVARNAQLVLNYNFDEKMGHYKNMKWKIYEISSFSNNNL